MCQPNRVIFATACTVLVIGLGVAVLSLCAQVRHARYNSGDISFPCRDDYDRAYFASRRWLSYCESRDILTWIIGDTYCASISGATNPPEMFAWTRRLCFAYWLPPGGTEPPKNLLRNANLRIVRLGFRQRPSAHLFEVCLLGSLRNVKRLGGLSHLKAGCASLSAAGACCERRDFLDYFRYPPRTRDCPTSCFAAASKYKMSAQCKK